MGTHYDTLGVKPSASAQEIRKAYLRRARALHPDRQLDRSESDARRAEEAMQVVNAAWDVLSDPKKKAAYDQRLKGAGARSSPQRSQQRPAQQRPAQSAAASAAGTQRSQPKASTVSGSAANQEHSGGIANILVSIPVLILIGVLVGVVIVVFFVNNDPPSGQIIVDNELAVQDCFVLVGDIPREVACASGQADGQVTSVGPDRGNCPESSQLPLRDPESDFYLCWARMIPGSSNTVP